jgi:hypothetical protein
MLLSDISVPPSGDCPFRIIVPFVIAPLEIVFGKIVNAFRAGGFIVRVFLLCPKGELATTSATTVSLTGVVDILKLFSVVPALMTNEGGRVTYG